MLVTVLTVVHCDGSPDAARAVARALGRVMGLSVPSAGVAATGSAVLPVPAGTAGARLAEELRAGELVAAGVALVVATSGSSGRSKGVELTAAALVASATATHARLGGPGRWLLALPAQHVAGAQVLVRSLLAGYEPAVLDLRPGFAQDAFAAAAAAMPRDTRRYTSLVPTQLVRLLDAEQAEQAEQADDIDDAADAAGAGAGADRVAGEAAASTGRAVTSADAPQPAGGEAGSAGEGDAAGDTGGGAGLAQLRAFDAVLVGGAACPPALLRRAREAGVRVVTTYGMSETAGGCVYDGVPLDGVRVRIGDGGRVELAGPMLARGYRLGTAAGSAEATAGAFRDGWFRTDDAGHFGPDGLLDVLGRLDDVIVTGGRKVAPALVERALAAVPGVGEVCVVGVPDVEWGQLVAAAVVARDPARPPDATALRGAARELAGDAAGPKLIRLVPALPLRGPGKVDRAAVRRLLSSGG